MWEVEQKFVVAEETRLLERLRQREIELGPPVEQVDAYFAHPSRDFAQTDEALRIRRVGDASFITYKGPKVDPQTKTRREIEGPLASGPQPYATYCQLLNALGFHLVAEVAKQRRIAQIRWRNRSVELCLDHVREVGAYCELEVQVAGEQWDEAREAIAELADVLELREVERRSYLELLLNCREQPETHPAEPGTGPG